MPPIRRLNERPWTSGGIGGRCVLNGDTFRHIRSAVLFLGGLAGIAYETLERAGERPTLLILFAAMVGLPAFLSVDERRRSPEKEPEGKT